MKVSGKIVAEAILNKLTAEVKEENLQPYLAIILANNYAPSRIYVSNKIKAAERIGVKAEVLEFSEDEQSKCLAALDRLNKDSAVNGVIIQYPVYKSWDFENLLSKTDPQKDVDGFLKDSPFYPATALGVWEMLTAFALEEGFTKVEDFLKNKKIVVLGRGKTAGQPTFELLQKKGFSPTQIHSKTENPNLIIKQADIVISATGVKNIINKSNLKMGAYVIGVGVGKEVLDGQEKIYGDINEAEVSQIAKLYCPTIGGIGPLTIVSLLKNVTESARRAQSSQA